MFNGDLKTDASNKIQQKGLSFSYSHAAINVGLDFISSVAESESFQEGMLDTGAADGSYLMLADYVPGNALHASYRTDHFNIIVERVAAMKEFATGDGTLAGKKPVTTNFEAGYTASDNTYAFGIQGSKDADGIEPLPKRKVLLGFSRNIFEHAGLGVELARTTHYANDEKESSLTARLAVEF